MRKSVKILVTYKDNHQPISSDILTPILTGRAISDDIFTDMIGDSCGDNISKQNAQYCELTAQYWAWKNYKSVGEPEHIGFMHYRRHFIFKHKADCAPNEWGLCDFEKINDKYFHDIGLIDKEITQSIEGYDIIIPLKISPQFKKQCGKSFSRAAFCSSGMLVEKDLEIMLDNVTCIFPEYQSAVTEFEKINYNYFCNMFVMKKELFFRYCEFLFTVLEACNTQIDMTNYSVEGMRTLGHLGERLLTIFVLKLQQEDQVKIKELPITFVHNTNYTVPLVPVFPEKNAICMCANTYFVPYLLVALQSLKDNALSHNYYDIIIFELDISTEHKDLIKEHISSDNIHIRFYNMLEYVDNFDSHISGEHLTIETYFRVLMPEICNNYDRLLYLDADMIINTDIANIFSFDLQGKTIAASPCIMWYGMVSSNKDTMEYSNSTLALSDPFQYFQAGVILFDVNQYNRKKISQICIEDLKHNAYCFCDQDLLNKVLFGDVAFLDYTWNYEIDSPPFQGILKHVPARFIHLREKVKNHPNIIHYNGPQKPWHHPHNELSSVWWSYARKTPLYEKLVLDLMMSTLSQKDTLSFKLSDIFKYVRYRLLSHITFGKRRKHYKEKKKQYQKRLSPIL